ncbi:hypothetical protein IGL98_000116 [Enterococcus sp. DIV0840]|uniref:amidase domain-containing protein n=1 Tax=Enterococcus TaxID=1350 RepID=UPI001A8FB5F8|nr:MULTISPECIES: amidase domain-containing protein [Enterococcus]MBO0433905.1 amidase domain-containing protein [Enterococcus sp. DIV0849a]MBO0475099.1 amidase domain-containing protein [Enterococcus ureasiticus]
MKKTTLRIVVTTCAVLSTAILTGFQANADESEGMKISEVVKEDIKNENSEIDLDQNLGQVQAELLVLFENQFNKKFETQLEQEYFEFLQNIEFGDLTLSSVEEENLKYSEFASIYLNRIGSILPVEPTEQDIDFVTQEKQTLLSKSFDEIKQENMNMILSTENSKPNYLNSRAGFNVAKATSYARTWATRRNMLFPSYSSDCTNFASQIAYYGGKPLRPNANGSGLNWNHNAGVNATRAWTLAHGFMTFWTADGMTTRQFTSKAQAQSYAREGDFIGYFKNNTYQFTHIAYVSKKSGSNIYITQHTTDRKDALWNNLDTSSWNSFVVLRF